MKRKLLFLWMLVLLTTVIFPVTASANTAQPPSLVIILKNAPEDATVALKTGMGLQQGNQSRAAWETCFVFYAQDTANADETLSVSGGGIEYEVDIAPQYRHGYESILTLDFSARTVSAGKLLSRSILLVGLRVALTFLIEGAVFYLFGFREKRSWIVFLVMNLLTQGWLNVSLNSGWPLSVYATFPLIGMELLIFVAETVGVLLFLREHRRRRRVGFVLTANLLSLILGGWLITVLPV